MGVSNFTAPKWKICSIFQMVIAARPIRSHYNLRDRSIERDLLPWCERHSIPVMAYSPLGGHRRQAAG